MDNTLKLKLKEFEKTLKTLEEVLKEKKTNIVRDSAIKRFEYTFDSCWKTSKVFLYEKFGIEIFSPKACFRELSKNGILSGKETELFIEMTDDRNLIVHQYKKEFSEKVYSKIKKEYSKMIKKVYEEIKE